MTNATFTKNALAARAGKTTTTEPILLTKRSYAQRAVITIALSVGVLAAGGSMLAPDAAYADQPQMTVQAQEAGDQAAALEAADGLAEFADYGLVGFESTTLNAHTNSNIMTDRLVANGQTFGTNCVSEPEQSVIAHVEGNMAQVTTSNGSTVVVGPNVSVSAADCPQAKMVNGAKVAFNGGNENTLIQADSDELPNFAELREHAGETSGALAALASNGTYDDRDMNRCTISASADGATVVAVDAATLSKYGTEVHIRSLDTGTAIVNVDALGMGNVQLPSIIVNDEPSRERSSWSAFNAIVNIVDSTKGDGMFSGNVSFGGRVIGIVLAPFANVIANHNVDGQIIASNIVINGEFHRDSYTPSGVDWSDGERDENPVENAGEVESAHVVEGVDEAEVAGNGDAGDVVGDVAESVGDSEEAHQEPAPEEADAGGATPEEATLVEVISGETAPEETAFEEADAGGAAPGEAAPMEFVSEEAVPEDATPEEPASEEAGAEENYVEANRQDENLESDVFAEEASAPEAPTVLFGRSAPPADPVEPAELVSLAEPAEPTEPASPAEPAEPTEPIEQTDATDPVELVDPVPTELVNPTEPAEPIEATEPVEPIQPSDPVRPIAPPSDSGDSDESDTIPIEPPTSGDDPFSPQRIDDDSNDVADPDGQDGPDDQDEPIGPEGSDDTSNPDDLDDDDSDEPDDAEESDEPDGSDEPDDPKESDEPDDADDSDEPDGSDEIAPVEDTLEKTDDADPSFPPSGTASPSSAPTGLPQTGDAQGALALFAGLSSLASAIAAAIARRRCRQGC
ncbi:MAG: LPXTG cell wall anchor domain-containing protein [Eggerthellaceae bacterium]|nr:LPXTG cell wall anchor domain-containing protein [Eggerthellaceae bacterium]